jgi:hypothetical protein
MRSIERCFIKARLSKPVLKLNTQIPFGTSPPAPYKERFLLTILSFRRIWLHSANGSHYAARTPIRDKLPLGVIGPRYSKHGFLSAVVLLKSRKTAVLN